jgi:hypothetical protein
MLSSIQMRFLLFLIGCIGTRSLLTYVSYIWRSSYLLPLLGYGALIPVIGWTYILFFGSRDTGPETFGQPIWWKNIRSVHLFLWLLFACMAISRNPYSWIVLFIDTLFGLLAFLWHHWAAGSFSKLL